jgi:hypothetical protein
MKPEYRLWDFVTPGLMNLSQPYTRHEGAGSALLGSYDAEPDLFSMIKISIRIEKKSAKKTSSCKRVRPSFDEGDQTFQSR